MDRYDNEDGRCGEYKFDITSNKELTDKELEDLKDSIIEVGIDCYWNELFNNMTDIWLTT